MSQMLPNVYIRPGYTKAIGKDVESAQILFGDYNYAKKFPVPKKGSKGAGIKFEQKVNDRIAESFDGYMPSVPVRYFSPAKSRVCILDGLLVTDSDIVIIECKLQHCIEAWHQLRCLYGPAVELALNRRVRLLEVVKRYEPEVVFPEPTMICMSLKQFLLSGADIGVWIWGR